MEIGGYRRRMGSSPFRNAREKEIYDVSFADWRQYKERHPDYFPHYHATTLQELAGERFQKVITVEGGEQYRFILWRGSVCDLEVDAVINAANGSLLGGGGVDGAIHDAAGPLITRECADKYDEVDTCGTVLTKGYRLPAHFVIHTVGPVYYHEQRRAQEKLSLCYYRSYELCEEHKLTSLGLCCISCGIYGYPPESAGRVAIQTALDWCSMGKLFPRTFVYVTYTERETTAYQNAFRELVIGAPDIIPRLVTPEEAKTEDEEVLELHPSHSVIPVMPEFETSTREDLSKDTQQTVEPEKPKEETVQQSEKPQYRAWADVPVNEWSEFKKQSIQLTDQKIAKVAGLPSVSILSKTITHSETALAIHVVQLDPAQLSVDCLVTLPCESLYAAAGDEIRADARSLESTGGVCVLKGYRLAADYVVLAKEGSAEGESGKEALVQMYRDSRAECEKLQAESVAFTALADGSAAEAYIALQEAINWLKTPESHLRTFVFIVSSEEEGRIYSQELRSALE